MSEPKAGNSPVDDRAHSGIVERAEAGIGERAGSSMIRVIVRNRWDRSPIAGARLLSEEGTASETRTLAQSDGDGSAQLVLADGLPPFRTIVVAADGYFPGRLLLDPASSEASIELDPIARVTGEIAYGSVRDAGKLLGGAWSFTVRRIDAGQPFTLDELEAVRSFRFDRFDGQASSQHDVPPMNGFHWIDLRGRSFSRSGFRVGDLLEFVLVVADNEPSVFHRRVDAPGQDVGVFHVPRVVCMRVQVVDSAGQPMRRPGRWMTCSTRGSQSRATRTISIDEQGVAACFVGVGSQYLLDVEGARVRGRRWVVVPDDVKIFEPTLTIEDLPPGRRLITVRSRHEGPLDAAWVTLLGSDGEPVWSAMVDERGGCQVPDLEGDAVAVVVAAPAHREIRFEPLASLTDIVILDSDPPVAIRLVDASGAPLNDRVRMVDWSTPLPVVRIVDGSASWSMDGEFSIARSWIGRQVLLVPDRHDPKLLELRDDGVAVHFAPRRDLEVKLDPLPPGWETMRRRVGGTEQWILSVRSIPEIETLIEVPLIVRGPTSLVAGAMPSGEIEQVEWQLAGRRVVTKHSASRISGGDALELTLVPPDESALPSER